MKTKSKRISWGQSKLTPDQRLAIRALALGRTRLVDIAKLFNIHPSTVRAIRDGRGSYETITVSRELRPPRKGIR